MQHMSTSLQEGGDEILGSLDGGFHIPHLMTYL